VPFHHAPPAFRRLTAAHRERRGLARAQPAAQAHGCARRAISRPATGSSACRPSPVAATAHWRMGGAIRRRDGCRNARPDPPRGRTPLDATTTPERLAPEACEPLGRARHAGPQACAARRAPRDRRGPVPGASHQSPVAATAGGRTLFGADAFRWRPCSFRDAPPAVPPVDVANRERRSVDRRQTSSTGAGLALRASLAGQFRRPPPVARRRDRGRAEGDTIGGETLSKTRAFDDAPPAIRRSMRPIARAAASGRGSPLPRSRAGTSRRLMPAARLRRIPESLQCSQIIGKIYHHAELA